MKKKVLCTALAVTMLLTTTVSATAKPWWLSKYRVTFDNELGNVGNVILTFASDGGSFIRPITKRYGESIRLESYIPTKYGYTFKGMDDKVCEIDTPLIRSIIERYEVVSKKKMIIWFIGDIPYEVDLPE